MRLSKLTASCILGSLTVLFLWSADNFVSRSIAKSGFEHPLVPLDVFAAPLIFAMVAIPAMIGASVRAALGAGRRTNAVAVSSVAAGMAAFFFIGVLIIRAV